MTNRKQLLISFLVLSGAGLVVYAYQAKPLEFWRWVDCGWVLIIISFVIMAYRYVILSVAAWILFILCMNSLITSLFFDVGEYGTNQKVFGWVVASGLGLAGMFYNSIDLYWKAQRQKENAKCRKDATRKYMDLLRRAKNIEDQLESKNETLDNLINQLLAK